MVLTYLAGGDKEKFCLDNLELLWISNSASSSAKENMYKHDEKCLQSKESATTVLSMAETLL